MRIPISAPQPQCNIVPFPMERAAASNFAHQSIEDVMQLSARASKCLARGGIRTLADLTRRSICNLAAIHGVGPHTLDEIMAEVSRLGMMLAVAGPSQLSWRG